MESWENKIWADKLNGLQELPAGYTPDLSSKWEIVEAGLPENKKRRTIPIVVRWSAAAAILLGAFFLWVNDNQLPKKTMAGIQSIQKIPLFVHEQQVAVVVDDSKNIAAKERIALSTKQKGKLVEAVSPQQKAIAKLDIQPAFINPDTVARLDTIGTPTEIGLASVAPVEKVKTIKKRIYQRDFNDGILVMDTGFSPQPRQHFSIQLNPFTRKTNDDEPPARRLLLKQAL